MDHRKLIHKLGNWSRIRQSIYSWQVHTAGIEDCALKIQSAILALHLTAREKRGSLMMVEIKIRFWCTLMLQYSECFQFDSVLDSPVHYTAQRALPVRSIRFTLFKSLSLRGDRSLVHLIFLECRKITPSFGLLLHQDLSLQSRE